MTNKKDFESKFREWFDLFCGHDPQFYQDLEWDWEEQIELFLEDPDESLKDGKELWKRVGDDEEVSL